MDPDFLQESWSGRVLICFQLPKEEVADAKIPDDIFTSAPRTAYLNAILEESGALEHFLRHAAARKPPSLWLSIKGEVVRWYLPIGIIADLYSISGPTPLEIEVHFRGDVPLDIPADAKTEKENGRECISVAKSYFLYRLKESLAVRNGSPKAALELSLDDTMSIWNAAHLGEYTSVKCVTEKLLYKKGTSKRTRALLARLGKSEKVDSETDSEQKRGTPESGASPSESKEAVSSPEKPSLAVSETKEETATNEDDQKGVMAAIDTSAKKGKKDPEELLRGLGSPWPHEIVKAPIRIARKDEPPALVSVEPDNDDGTPKLLGKAVEEACQFLVERGRLQQDWAKEYEVLIDGLPLPKEAPLEWFSLYGSAPDMSLYIVLRRTQQ